MNIEMICRMYVHLSDIFSDAVIMVTPVIIGPFLFLMVIVSLFLLRVLRSIRGFPLRSIQSISSGRRSSNWSSLCAWHELHRRGRCLSFLPFLCWQKGEKKEEGSDVRCDVSTSCFQFELFCFMCFENLWIMVLYNFDLGMALWNFGVWYLVLCNN